MLSIQDVGKEILTGNPRSFYAMTGPEYGIKATYISKLEELYGKKVESKTVEELIKFSSVKHLFPPKPAVYVVRYDEEFIQSLTDRTQSQIDSLVVPGCIICIYESSKHESKLSKYLPNSTVHINLVDGKFVRRYLHTDFPNLPDRLIDSAAHISNDYGHAKNIARSMSNASVSNIFDKSD